MKHIPLPSGAPIGRLSCPTCHNAEEFVEIASNVQVTNRYLQNNDGAFTLKEKDTEVYGDMHFICGRCGHDMHNFHTHFRDMAF